MMQTCVAHPLRFLQKVGLPNSKPLEILPLIFLKGFLRATCCWLTLPGKTSSPPLATD
jgi:hypothetical protein